MITVQDHIAGLGAYAPPWSGLDRRPYLRLDLNECTRPLPKVAVEAITRQLEYVHLYPSYESFIPTLADYCGQPAECLLVTNGSDQGIDVILRAFLGRGDPMVIARPEFPMFAQTANVLDARIVGVPYEQGFRFPYDEFRQAITAETRLVVVINPNNPTGTPVELDYIAGLLDDFPETPVLVDEAYYEYTGESVIDLVPKYPNLIVLRTFSKAFAMAGLRLGYVVAQPGLIREFEKIRGPFDVNSLAIAAADAQIRHPEECIAGVAEVMTKSKPLVESFLESSSVTMHRGAANFLLVESPRRDAIVEHLKANGVLVRPMKAESMQSMFRMSVGSLEEMQRFVELFASFLETT